MTGRRLLALNVGSTTLKGAVYALESATAGTPPQLVECNRAEIHTGPEPEESLAALLKALAEPVQRPDVVVHRIVHGGDLRGAHELDEQLIAKLDALAPFAPLHQPIALAFVRAARVRWPQARQGVAFDTDFHASLAPWSRRLPVPAEWDAMGVRRYGFHGLAFASALREVTAHDSSILKGRVVLAHLGGGCSICAVKDGRSHDTTMALTPLGGIRDPPDRGTSIRARCCICCERTVWVLTPSKTGCTTQRVWQESQGTATCVCCSPSPVRVRSLPWSCSPYALHSRLPRWRRGSGPRSFGVLRWHRPSRASAAGRNRRAPGMARPWVGYWPK